MPQVAPFFIIKSQVVPFFIVTWPPNLFSSDTFKGISGPDSDSKLAPNIIDKYKLALIPDSPAWFAWLETISSLRFLGQQGRWSAYRDKRRAAHGWFAYRRIHGQQNVHALGSPHELTIACFEQMASILQSYVTTS